MERNQGVVTAGIGILAVAAVITGALEKQIAEALFEVSDPARTYGQPAFLLSVPLGFSAVTLLLPGTRSLWLPLVVVATCSGAAAGLVIVIESDRGQALSRADIFAGQVAIGTTYFSTGMLLPLAVTVGRLALRVRGPSARGVLP